MANNPTPTPVRRMAILSHFSVFGKKTTSKTGKNRIPSTLQKHVKFYIFSKYPNTRFSQSILAILDFTKIRKLILPSQSSA